MLISNNSFTAHLQQWSWVRNSCTDNLSHGGIFSDRPSCPTNSHFHYSINFLCDCPVCSRTYKSIELSACVMFVVAGAEESRWLRQRFPSLLIRSAFWVNPVGMPAGRCPALKLKSVSAQRSGRQNHKQWVRIWIWSDNTMITTMGSCNPETRGCSKRLGEMSPQFLWI